MSKYIIEIEDEPFGRNDDPVIPHGMDELYRAKGFNSLVFDENGLEKLTSFDKALEEAYQKGLDDAWKAIIKIAKMPDVERMTHFGEVWISNILNAYSLEQIFTILEKSEFESDEIKVGDEVECLETGCTYIIHEINGKDVIGYNFKRQYTCYGEKNDFKKTGRHFPQVEELINAMKGEKRICSTCKYNDGSDVPKCSDCCLSKGYNNKWEPKEGAE